MNFNKARTEAIKVINKQLGLKLQKTISIQDIINMIINKPEKLPTNVFECYSLLLDIANDKYRFQQPKKMPKPQKPKKEVLPRELTKTLRKKLYFSYQIVSSPNEPLESLITRYCVQKNRKTPETRDDMIKLAKDLVSYTKRTSKNPKVDRRMYVSAKAREEFYQSEEWKSLRYAILKEQGGRCQCCGRTAQDGVTLCVDHIIPLSKDWSRRLDRNNLQVLCEDCNSAKSDTDCIDWRRKK